MVETDIFCIKKPTMIKSFHGDRPTTKMATKAPVPGFQPADVVYYGDKGQYIVLAVEASLGFNRCHIMSLENGEKEITNRHELTKVHSNIVGKPEDIPIPDEKVEELNGNDNKPRFKTLNAEELDDLARKRTEKATDKQTTLALKIFKGKKFNVLAMFVNKR